MSTENTPGMRRVRIDSVMWEAPSPVVDEIDRLVDEVAELSAKFLDHKDFIRRVEKQASEVRRLSTENSDLKEFIASYPLTNNRPTDLAIERGAWVEKGKTLVSSTQESK